MTRGVFGPAPEPFEEATSPTYLDEEWFSGPAVEERTLQQRETTKRQIDPTRVQFGPGLPDLPPRRHRRPRERGWFVEQLLRFKVALAFLVAVVGFLAWQHLRPHRFAVDIVSVSTRSERLHCGQSALVTGTLHSNGAGGTVRYRWQRNDGTQSSVLRERVPRGAKTAVVRMSWSFSGRGVVQARATLHLLAPRSKPVAVTFSYNCVE
ncbi:hypothetical protein ACFYW6_37820 [Streptomyces sp. NPDC002659]|uniref:hypothetical protein n=1 Tax=Streptomyces sp. NPDC002659 TaxID=3364656 RepID=UPI0036AEC956